MFTDPGTKATSETKPKVVVAGSGWAGISFCRDINLSSYEVTLVSPVDHFCFTPLLPAVLSKALGTKDVSDPLSKVLPKGIERIQSCIESVDIQRKVGKLWNGAEINFDYLVWAVGTEPNTFGIPGVPENAKYLKNMENVEALQDCVDSVINKDDEDRAVFVIGAGPAGVEVAAEIADRVKARNISTVDNFYIGLIEMANKALPALGTAASEAVRDEFAKKEFADLHLETQLMRCSNDSVTLRSKVELDVPSRYIISVSSTPDGFLETKLKSNLIIWSSGIKQRANTMEIMETQRDIGVAGRAPGIVTDISLRAKGIEWLFAVGDTAFIVPDKISSFVTGRVSWWEKIRLATILPQLGDARYKRSDIGKLDPIWTPTAQNAQQQGKFLAGAFNQYQPNKALPAFCFNSKGSACYLGSHRAFLNIGNTFVHNGIGSAVVWKSFYISKQLRWAKSLSVGLSFFGRSVIQRCSIVI